MASQNECNKCYDPESDAPPDTIKVTPPLMQNALRRYAKMALMGEPSIPVFIYGAPGIGKTDIVNQVGKELGMKVYTFIASTMDPSDVRGIPVANTKGGYSEWLPPRDFKEDASREPAIYFFDELNLAPMDTRAAFYQLILSGKLEGIDISNSLRIGAGNNKRLVPELRNSWLGTPLATRFNVYWMIPDLASWIDYARTVVNGKPRVDPIVVDFILNYTSITGSPTAQVLYCVNPDPNCIGYNNATPRGWVKISDMIRHGLTTEADFASAIGLHFGRQFKVYYDDTIKKGNNGQMEKPFNLADEIKDVEGLKKLSAAGWVASFEYTWLNYFSGIRAEMRRGTATNNIVYQFDEKTLVLTVNEDISRHCLNLWKNLQLARTEILLALSKKDGFNFMAYLSSINNDASRARDIILYRLIEKEKPEQVENFKAFETFILGKPFMGYEIKPTSKYPYTSLSQVLNHLRSEGYTII